MLVIVRDPDYRSEGDCDLLLLDGNNVAVRADHVMHLINPAGERVSAVFGALRTLRAVVSDFAPRQVVVAWDLGSSKRKELFPSYKSRRRAKYTEADFARFEDLKRQLNVLQGILQFLPVGVAVQGGVEADDIIYQLSRDEPGKVIVVSGDSDLLQLVSDRVSVLKPGRTTRDGTLVTPENFKREVGYKSTEHFVIAKCLIGDSTDDIPGVSGIGEKYAASLLEAYSSFDEMVIAAEAGRVSVPARYQKKAIKALSDTRNQDVFDRNYKLIKLGEFEDAEFKVQEGDDILQAFEDFCVEQDFQTILGAFTSWIAPFRYLMRRRDG